MKTLRWAISQFASVERIVGEDKYFCENCHHYTEAERSLLFDKMPEVITIHLKCFAASGLEWVLSINRGRQWLCLQCCAKWSHLWGPTLLLASRFFGHKFIKCSFGSGDRAQCACLVKIRVWVWTVAPRRPAQFSHVSPHSVGLVRILLQWR